MYTSAKHMLRRREKKERLRVNSSRVERTRCQMARHKTSIKNHPIDTAPIHKISRPQPVTPPIHQSSKQPKALARITQSPMIFQPHPKIISSRAYQSAAASSRDLEILIHP